MQGVVGPIPATGLIVAAGYLAAQGWQWPFIVYTAAFPLCVAAAFWLFEPARSTQSAVEQVASASATPFPYRTLVVVCLLTALTFMLCIAQIGILNEFHEFSGSED